jgi:hypothetical protein
MQTKRIGAQITFVCESAKARVRIVPGMVTWQRLLAFPYNPGKLPTHRILLQANYSIMSMSSAGTWAA